MKDNTVLNTVLTPLTSYERGLTILKNLKKLELKPHLLGDKVHNTIPSFEKIIETYKEQGFGKLADSMNKLITALFRLSNKLQNKEIYKLTEYREAISYLIKMYTAFDPNNQKITMGIESDFSFLEEEALTLKVENNAIMALDKAPIFFVTKTQPKGITLKALKNMKATLHKRTQGVSIQSIPVLIINLNVIDKSSLKRTVKHILKEIRPKDTPVPLFKLMEARRNLVAIPCIRQEHIVPLQDFLEKSKHKLYVK